MSMLIKGMKMPKTCKECDIEDDYYFCPLRKKDTDEVRVTGRRKDCPLVEVAEPHGRLIDENDISVPSLDTSHDQVLVFEAIKETTTIIEAEGSEE